MAAATPPTHLVFKTNTFTTHGTDGHNGGSVTVEDGAYLMVTGDNPLELFDLPWTVKVDGVIESNVNPIAIYKTNAPATKNSTVTIGSEGMLWSSGLHGLSTEQLTDVSNSGLIHGQDIGISEALLTSSSVKSVTITNNATGRIEATDYGILFNPSQALTVKNAGTISATYALTWIQGLNLTNSGSITGDLIGSTDPLNTLGNTIANSGSIFGDINLSDLADTVKNTGSISGKLDMFNGNNSLTNSGSFFGQAIFSQGDDTFSSTNSFTGDVTMSNGENKFTNSGKTSGNVTFGVDVDTFANSGTMFGKIDLSNGDNKFTNSGVMKQDSNKVLLSAGDNNDTVTNSGSLNGYVTLGNGDNTVTNTGFIDQVVFGTGNDTLKNTGTINVNLSMGAGNDTFIGGNQAEQMFDEAGNDKYSMGGGDDFVTYGFSGTDMFDGGAGNDRFDASGVTTAGLVFNLDTKASPIPGFMVAGGTITGTNEVQVATLKGFESLIGTAKGDWIIGGTGAESLDGNGGGDVIVGGGGADTLWGNAGADQFLYLSTKDAAGLTKASRETIRDFDPSEGDSINLTLIDANTKATDNQDFDWIGPDTAFSKHAGELRYVHEGPNVVLQGDTNGDGKADFAILLVGVTDLDAGDVVG